MATSQAGPTAPGGGGREPAVGPNPKTVAVLTVDARQVACAKALVRRGFRVVCWGQPVNGLSSGDVSLLAGASLIVGPVTGPPSPEAMAAVGARWAPPGAWPLSAGVTYVGGRPGDELTHALARAGGRCYDLLADEAFAQANAWPTAEAAVLRAQQLSGTVAAGTPCVVLGYGRCGRALARTLAGLGARVTVVARRRCQRWQAGARGLAAVDFDRLPEILSQARWVFNTVPAPVLGERELASLAGDGLVIDIASRPGGVDWEAARRLGVAAHLELGLPARFFPVTAGEILAEAVIRIAAAAQPG